MILLLLLLLLLWAPGRADDVLRVTMHTDPEGADIYLDVSGTKKYEKFLGQTGQPILLDLGALHGASGFDVVFKRAGYHDKSERIAAMYFQTRDSYPENGAIPLQATSPLVTLRTFASANPLPLGLSLGLGVLAAGFGLRRRARTQATLRRGRVLEEFQARADVSDPHIMARVDNYRLVELLGIGGNAKVYKGIPDATLDESQAVAVKLFKTEVTSAQDFVDRFKREAGISSQLSHPGILKLFAWGEQEGLYYLVMELLRGEPLRSKVRPDGLPVPTALGWLIPSLEAVAHAHRKGVIHRDLKPENIMVIDSGAVKVMDFGLARELISNLTQTGTVLGTPAYMSPEQINGKFLDYSSDQYSLGVVAYELLAGRTPFLAADMMELMIKVLQESPTPLRELRPDVPPGLEAAIMRMLSREPSRRFESLDDVVVELGKFR